MFMVVSFCWLVADGWLVADAWSVADGWLVADGSVLDGWDRLAVDRFGLVVRVVRSGRHRGYRGSRSGGRLGSQ
jgi:hypothetical protein